MMGEGLTRMPLPQGTSSLQNLKVGSARITNGSQASEGGLVSRKRLGQAIANKRSPHMSKVGLKQARGSAAVSKPRFSAERLDDVKIARQLRQNDHNGSFTEPVTIDGEQHNPLIPTQAGRPGLAGAQVPGVRQSQQVKR